MDQAEYSRMAGDYVRKYQAGGEDSKPGVYNLKIVGDDGDTAQGNSIINIGGRMFKSNEEGRLRILDSEFLNEEISAFKELRDYETRIMEALLVSDDTAFLILGGKEGAAKILLEKGGGEGELKVPGLRDSGIDVNAMPSQIRYLDPTSTEYARSLSKLRIIVSKLGIIINEEGGDLKRTGTAIREAREAKNSGNDMPPAK
jgi:hypothetical protein